MSQPAAFKSAEAMGPKPFPAKAAPPAAPAAPAALPNKKPSPAEATLKRHGVSVITPTALKQVDPTKIPLSILYMGEKGAGKTSNLAGLPRPFGGKTYIISFDKTSSDGLLNRYTPEQLEAMGVVLFEPAKPIYNEAGECLYSGYDPQDTATAEVVIAQAQAILDHIEDAGDADNIVLDHFQALYEDVGQNYCRFKAGVDTSAKLEFAQWNPRFEKCNEILNRAFTLRRYAIVITGYPPESKNVARRVFDEKKGKEVTKITKEVVTPKYVEKFQRDFTVVLAGSTTKDEETGGDRRWWVEVQSSKTPLFPLDATVDITGKDVGHFWTQYHASRAATPAPQGATA